MFFIFFVVLGIVIGYAAGGRLSNLLHRPLRYSYLAISALVIQLVIFSDFPFVELIKGAIVPFHFVSYACLLAFVLLNRRHAGVVLAGLGIFLNSFVIFINGGYMPTFAENIKNTSMAGNAEAVSQGEAVHNSMQATGDTLFPWLGDIFYLPSWFPLSNVFSIGDILIAVGICLYLIMSMQSHFSGESEVRNQKSE